MQPSKASRRWSPTPVRGGGPCASRIDPGYLLPVITAALMQRFSSQGNGDFANQLLALMRNAFGGHAVEPRPQAGAGSRGLRSQLMKLLQ